jgi:hypothetical protein
MSRVILPLTGKELNDLVFILEEVIEAKNGKSELNTITEEECVDLIEKIDAYEYEADDIVKVGVEQ